MKHVFHDRVEVADITDRVSPALRPAASMVLSSLVGNTSERVGLLVFGNSARDVVLSSHVRRAIRKLHKCESQNVAVGARFTSEAVSLLHESGFHIGLLPGAVEWTDDSYKRIRQNQKAGD